MSGQSRLAHLLLLWLFTTQAVAWSGHPARRNTVEGTTLLHEPTFVSRRAAIAQTVAGLSVLASQANAEPSNEQFLVDFLKNVPTFAIVDAKGVPFMVFGEDAKVTGYFFISYDEADRVLKLARSSAEENVKAYQSKQKRRRSSTTTTTSEDDNNDSGEDPPINPWKDAKITTVPMDVAVSLTSSTISQRAKNYFQLAASAADLETALDLTGKDDIPEGKVPLFYIDEETFRTPDGRQPLYFGRDQLLRDYRRQQTPKASPKVQVTELFATLKSMATSEDPEMRQLALQVPPNSPQKARECTQSFVGKKSDQRAPFVLGQRIIVL